MTYFGLLGRFIIADKAVGATGWRAVWTEVTVPESGECEEGALDCGGACLPAGARCSGLKHCALTADTKPTHC